MAKSKPIQVNLNINVTSKPSDGAAAPWDGELIAGRVLKDVPEQRYTLTVAYPVNKPDVGKARDGHRDFAAADEIEKAAWNYLTESPMVGQWHENGTEGAGRVVESYIWRFADQVIKCVDGSEYTVVKGDWLLGIVWDQPAYDNFKSGKATGVSMQGQAKRKTPSPLDLANLRKSSNDRS